jgi:glutaredoxin
MTAPQPISRPQEYQNRIDQQTQRMSLYQFEGCPFCIKVRRALKKMNLKIELRDAQNNEHYKRELIQEGGSHQVPCLRIEKDNGSVQWMYESSDIILFLRERFSE